MAIVIERPAGDVDLLRGLISGEELARQKIKARLQFFLGEWFLDVRLGVPYFRDILRKGADVDVVTAILRRVILETDGVAAVEQVSVSSTVERELTVNYSATLENGARVVSATESIFV